MPQSLIPYSNIKDIVVDPYTFGGVELNRFVKEAVRMLRPELQVLKRESKTRLKLVEQGKPDLIGSPDELIDTEAYQFPPLFGERLAI